MVRGLVLARILHMQDFEDAGTLDALPANERCFIEERSFGLGSSGGGPPCKGPGAKRPRRQRSHYSASTNFLNRDKCMRHCTRVFRGGKGNCHQPYAGTCQGLSQRPGSPTEVVECCNTLFRYICTHLKPAHEEGPEVASPPQICPQPAHAACFSVFLSSS